MLLGSIPELPAISCKEIKASDGERGVSGNYWFNSVIPGKTIQLYCDMDLEGKKCEVHYACVKKILLSKHPGFVDLTKGTKLSFTGKLSCSQNP